MGQIQCLLIRHGKTKGNMEKRYIGSRTDEALCPQGVEELQSRREVFDGLKVSDTVYTSPLLRCRQTAKLFFPSLSLCVVEGLQEIDFGEFENRNYLELAENEYYQKWLDSGGSLPFPSGETREDFSKRTYKAFCNVLLKTYSVEQKSDEILPFVIHGGSIMAIMSQLTGQEYFDFQIDCGDAYLLRCAVGEKKIDVISYDSLPGGRST